MRTLCGYFMSRVFTSSLVVQLVLVSCFLWFGWQADQAMDKAGIGDLDEWNRLNGWAGMAFFGTGIIWLATILLAAGVRAVGSVPAQLAIGVPPLGLVVGWWASWLV